MGVFDWDDWKDTGLSVKEQVSNIFNNIGKLITFVNEDGVYITVILDKKHGCQFRTLHDYGPKHLYGMGDTELESLKAFCKKFCDELVDTDNYLECLYIKECVYKVTYNNNVFEMAEVL